MRSVVACIGLLIVGAGEVVAQGPAPDIAIDPGAFDYGDVTVGTTRERAFALSNEGTADLVVFETSIQGPDAADFPLVGAGGGFILRPGATRLISVRFAPASLGAKSAVLRIDSNDPDETPLDVSLTGVGRGFPDIALSRTTLSYGGVSVGSSSALDLLVENRGAADLALSEIGLTGTDADQFMIERGNQPFTLAPQALDTITVRFTPTSEGDKNAVLRLTSNDPDESPFDVALVGRGVRPAIAADPVSHDFGQVGVGATATHDFVISNVGTADLVVDSLAFQGAGAGQFQVARGGAPFTLRPGATRLVTVQFAPSLGGVQSAVLVLFSNDPAQPSLNLAVQGTVLTPSMALSTASLDFGDILVSLGATQTVDVSNTGSVDLVVTRLTVTGGDSTEFVALGGTPFTVVPGGSVGVGVRFAPTSEGPKASMLRVAGNDPDRPALEVALSGVGGAVQLDIAEAAALEQDVPFTVTLPPSFQPVFRRLRYRGAGERNFREANLTGTGPVYQGVIPGPAVTLRGVEYYIRLDDAQGSIVTVPAVNPEVEPLFLPVQLDRFAVPDSLRAWTFRMVSIPLDLASEEVEAVLFDDYGPYNTRKWRLFEWDQTLNGGDGDYVEYPDIQGGFTAGASLWLITNDGVPFTLENARSREPRNYTVTLKPGWNQIGNPYAFSVRWPGQALDPRLEAPVFFDGIDFQYDQLILMPWEGYFVRNMAPTPITLTFSPSQSTGSNAKAGDATARFNLDQDPRYLLRLSAEVDGTSLRDTQNYLGFVDEASEDHDGFDFTEAPPIGDYVRLSIVERGERYAGNFKPIREDGQHWELAVDGTFSGRTVRVRLTDSGVLPEGYGLYVFDRDTGRALAVEDGGFSLDLQEASQARHLRLIVGTERYAEDQAEDIPPAPLAFALDQNYPNPFNPQTTIRYRIGEQSPVRLEVYNLMGQRVRTLVHATQNAGSYAVRWDGRNDGGTAAASGVYVYRLRAGAFLATRTMLLLR